ncbi:aspartyl protease family protein At5g10770-like [Magnolia sinica]|uniref:aspartyl protease family protein At5g10770-like n=1 Tax=Magnolia sinica TaxID=86752 RepID=UPI00265A0093|nr:aspartyl protease family protein At5g10770-like [Magnolia sinica]
MATIFQSHLFFTILLLLASLLDYSKVYGVESESYHVIQVTSLLPKRSCSTPSGFNQTGLKIVHRRGPCSPFGQEKASTREILMQDQSRVDSLMSRISSGSQRVKTQDTEVPAQLGSSLGTQNYIVTVGFGTPEKKLSIAFDTGSDFTWIQCSPCPPIKCYSQQEPLFDPSESTSYRNVSCDSPQCAQLDSATGNPHSCSSTCQYTVEYGDSSSSSGSFASETLTLTPSDVILNFPFGCGHENQGLFGRTAGLLGLGRDPLSLVSQTALKYNRVFSYCLPSPSSSDGYLKFGSDAITSSNLKFTQMGTNPKAPSFYFLTMIGIRVAGEDLPIQASTFASPGTIIDSGTVITRLQPAAYMELRSTFRKSMSNYTMTSEYEIFDTCYDFSGLETVNVPKIVLRFQGDVEVEVDVLGIFYPVNNSQICLAFVGNRYTDSLGIIGNRQQRKINVVYDVGGERVGFGAGGCS